MKVLNYRVKALEMSDFEKGTISINGVLSKQIIIERLLDNNKLNKIEEIHDSPEKV